MGSDDAWIGDVSDDGRQGTCVFSVGPSDPRCGAPATVHLCCESAIYGPVGLTACNAHAPIARMAGPLLGEHPFTADCMIRVTRFSDDGCRPE